MLEVLTRFGGHAESSDDGKLVYVFPKLQITTISDAAGSSGAAAAAAREAATPRSGHANIVPATSSTSV